MVNILRQGGGGVPVVELCRQQGVSEQTFYRWKKRFGDLGTAEVRLLADTSRALATSPLVDEVDAGEMHSRCWQTRGGRATISGVGRGGVTKVLANEADLNLIRVPVVMADRALGRQPKAREPVPHRLGVARR